MVRRHGFVVAKNQLTRRLQNFQYSNINRRGDNGFSHYNSVAVRVQVTNLSNTGLSLHSSYTYAHAIDNISSTFSESNNNANLGLLDPSIPRLTKATPILINVTASSSPAPGTFLSRGHVWRGKGILGRMDGRPHHHDPRWASHLRCLIARTPSRLA